MFPHPQNAPEWEVRGFHHLQTKQPRPGLVSPIAPVQFKQPVEKQRAHRLIDQIPWLTAQGGKLETAEQRVQKKALESNARLIS